MNPLHPRMLCVPKLAQCFWRRGFLNFVNVFSLFLNYLPLEKGGTLHLKKLKSPLPKDALCQVWLKLAQWFWRRRFSNFVNVFSLFRNYLPLEKDTVLHLNKLNSLHSTLFRNYLPLEKGEALHLKKNLNPLHPRMLLTKVWIKFAEWF